MKRMTATEGRRQLFRLLDDVERGEEIVLERNGVRFRILLAETETTRRSGPSPLEFDEEVLEGQWTWAENDEGSLTFRAED